MWVELGGSQRCSVLVSLRCYYVVESALNVDVSKLYVQAYFPDKVKQTATAMLEQVHFPNHTPNSVELYFIRVTRLFASHLFLVNYFRYLKTPFFFSKLPLVSTHARPPAFAHTDACDPMARRARSDPAARLRAPADSDGIQGGPGRAAVDG